MPYHGHAQVAIFVRSAEYVGYAVPLSWMSLGNGWGELQEHFWQVTLERFSRRVVLKMVRTDFFRVVEPDFNPRR